MAQPGTWILNDAPGQAARYRSLLGNLDWLIASVPTESNAAKRLLAVREHLTSFFKVP